MRRDSYITPGRTYTTRFVYNARAHVCPGMHTCMPGRHKNPDRIFLARPESPGPVTGPELVAGAEPLSGPDPVVGPDPVAGPESVSGLPPLAGLSAPRAPTPGRRRRAGRGAGGSPGGGMRTGYDIRVHANGMRAKR